MEETFCIIYDNIQGKNYIEMLEISIFSIRLFHPEVPIYIFSEEDTKYLDKIKQDEHIFINDNITLNNISKMIYLHADTFIVDEIDDLPFGTTTKKDISILSITKENYTIVDKYIYCSLKYNDIENAISEPDIKIIHLSGGKSMNWKKIVFMNKLKKIYS